MHELSIAQNILEIVSGQCVARGYQRIDSVNLRIGRASGIMPDALLFAFDAIKSDSIARDAVLHIEEMPVSGRCNDCKNVFLVEEEYVLSCPSCGGRNFRITGGREMDVIDMEVS
jgi:hydrogenase nickel incorporation protein HypA/HybF